jgi:hypothetical protein
VKRLFHLVFLCCLIVFLVGCSTNTLVMQDASLSDGKGLFVLEIISNSTNRDDMFASISIWSDTEKKVYYAESEEAMDPDNSEMKSTAYFVATLPEGKYWIDSGVSHESHRTYSRTLTIPTHDILGSFQIVNGEVTDLGTVAYLPAPKGEDVNSSPFRLMQFDGKHQFEETFSHKYPKLYAQTKNRPVHRWDALQPFLANKFVRSYIKKNTHQINKFIESSDGEIFVGGRFGQILRRTVDGAWVSLDTGSTREIMDVDKSSRNDIYAMGESIVLVSRDDGRTWQGLPLPTPPGPFMDILVSPDDELLLLVRTARTFIYSKYTVFQYDQHAGDWNEKYTLLSGVGSSKVKVPVDVASGFFPDLRYAINGEHFAISNGEMKQQSGGMSLNKPKYLYDGTLSNVSDMHTEASGNAEDIKVGKVVNQVGVSFYDYRKGKRDYVCHWPRLGGYYTRDSVFLNRDQGWVLVSKKISLAGAVKKTMLFFTNDGGKTWENMKEMPGLGGMSNLFASSSGVLFVQEASTSGNIYSSRDFGKTWTTERTTHTLQELLDAIQKRSGK